MKNSQLFKNFQERRKIFKDNKMFFKDQGHNHIDIKFKESPWRSRTSGNLSEVNLHKTIEGNLFWLYTGYKLPSCQGLPNQYQANVNSVSLY